MTRLERIIAPTAARHALAASFVHDINRGEKALELAIRVSDQRLTARDFAAYLDLLDGIYGRLDPLGFRSYSHSPERQLEISSVAAGSIDLRYLFELFSDLDVWRALILYLVARVGPALLKGEAAKNWAEAAKAAVETYKALQPTPVVPARNEGRVSSTQRDAAPVPPYKLSRGQRQELNSFLDTDPYFSKLSKRHRRQVIASVEELLAYEQHRFARVERFNSRSYLGAVLRRVRRTEGEP